MQQPIDHEPIAVLDSNSVETAWRELSAARREVAVHRRMSARPDLHMYYAVDDLGRPGMLVIDAAIPPPRLPALESLDLDLRVRTDGQMTLGIYLADSEYQSAFAQLFAAIGNDLVKASVVRSQIEFVLDRVRAWQQFLERSRFHLLTLAEQQGLWGELATMEWLLATSSPGQVLEAWKGPTHEAQDFRLEDMWIECKTIGPLDEEIKIANLQQFELGPVPLHLVIHSIVEDSSGHSLPDKVSRIRRAMLQDPSATEMLERLLRHAGYSDEHDYPARYVLQRSRWYCVSERFPRLATSNIPDGVTAARYQIRVSALNNFIEAEPRHADRPRTVS